jgi:hypothetical protein
MPLYTFFLDYHGGTYISQVRARSHISAPKVWAEKLDLSQIKGFNEELRQQLLEDLQRETPVSLEGIKYTWCCTSTMKGHLVLIHFTQTTE